MGNQMFQYAAGLAAADHVGTQLYIDLSALLDRSRGNDFVYREFDLGIFELEPHFLLNPLLVKQLSVLKSSRITRYLRNTVSKNRMLFKESQFKYDPHYISKLFSGSIMEGWFQSPLYFKAIEDQVRQSFKFKNEILPISQELLNNIRQSNSVCLNVRRTDFLKVSNLNTTDLSYFMRAVNKMKDLVENPRFFIFSDDLEWCRDNIKLDFPYEVVDYSHKGNKFGNYLQLMIACKHFIIPNSSFAWWAAWLSSNKNKKVIAPLKWFQDSKIDTNNLTPDEWYRI